MALFTGGRKFMARYKLQKYKASLFSQRLDVVDVTPVAQFLF
jgi:hypothetical protein